MNERFTSSPLCQIYVYIVGSKACSVSIHHLLALRHIDNTGSCKHAVFILDFPCCSMHSTFYYNDPAFPKEAKLKADGSFDKEKDKEAVEEMVKDEELKAKLLAAIEECDVTAKADKCEAAYEFVKCKKAKAGSH
ncbi:unnamed protein product [Nezara viridula]|uniref:Uncharacterized protein n=1 Tax=Nezara viridula TaxID=85310 RepID=A0A9P0HW24_NEZVI|nr:unnamed protein product [Nezara viridula]